MPYLATVTLDYTKTNRNSYQKILCALDQAGWTYAETSAMVLESDDLTEIQLALDLLSRSIHTGGTLSALTMQVQRVDDTKARPAFLNVRPNALSDLKGLPSPAI